MKTLTKDIISMIAMEAVIILAGYYILTHLDQFITVYR